MKFAELIKAQIVIMKALSDAANAENRLLTDDEQNKYDAAKNEIARLEKAKASADEIASIENSIPKPEVHVPASVSDTMAAGVQVGDDLAAKKPYKNLGDMLADVRASKLHSNQLALGRLINAKLNTETGSDGGFLVQPELMGNMMEDAIAESQIFSRVTELQLSGNTASIPGVDESSRADGQRYGGISVNWVAEGGQGTYTQPKFRNIDIKLSKLMGLTAITEEMVQDSVLLTSWVQRAFPAEMAFALDQAIFDGDGNGKPLGILNAGNGALVTVAKETSQAADTIVYENIVKMWARMPARRQMNAVWYITPQAQEQLPLMNLSVGTGGLPVYLPPGGASVSPYATLFGRPVIPIEQATALGDKGDIVLADMSDYIAVAKGGIRTASSIHVYFDTDCMAYRFVKRVNGVPYTKNALQSRANSNFTTSPYVTLAARA